ncbi:hypothetical protein CARUB_v10003266mg, partial [Capsella rubella]
KIENHEGLLFLVIFNYTTEIFERMCLPYYYSRYSLWTRALSVVKEDKFSVLLPGSNMSQIEIWVTNKIDETKVVSWSMFLAVDYSKIPIRSGVRFLVDEEKRIILCWDRIRVLYVKFMIHIVEEDNKVTELDLDASTMSSCMSPSFTYVPCLVQNFNCT